MQQGEWVVLAFIVIVIVAAVLIWLAMRRRDAELRRDEYNRTPQKTGKRGGDTRR